MECNSIFSLFLFRANDEVMMKMPAYADVNELVEACYSYLKSHETTGEKYGFKYHTYFPANTKYGHHQWLWDSGWHMMAWSYREPINAIEDLRTMLQFQQPNGFIPEIIFWGDEHLPWLLQHLFGYSHAEYTDLTQMPMLPWSLRAIWNATNDIELLKEFVPKLVAYFDWWANERDPDGDGLVSIIHPWESGIDASPLYDPAHGIKPKNQGKFWKHYPKFIVLQYHFRRAKWDQQKILKREWFNFEDVGVCSVYAAGWGVLSSLAAEFDEELAAKCKQQQARFEQAIISKCWDEQLGRFVSFYHKKGKECKATAETIQSLFPILLDSLPQEILEKMIATIRDPAKFWLPHPMPSVAKSEQTFNPLRSRLLWRGTTWPIDQWFVMEGLIAHGREDIAKQLLDKWVSTYLEYGVWEYYNPLTGEGLGEEGIGMSCCIVDMINRLGKLE
jgi:hypothetical protein